MKKHLTKIAKIIANFKANYNFTEAYLSIQGAVTINTHSSLKVECNSELDNFTLKDVKRIKSDIYEEIRKYMEKNKINKTLYIETEYRGWAASNIVIFFKQELKC